MIRSLARMSSRRRNVIDRIFNKRFIHKRLFNTSAAQPKTTARNVFMIGVPILGGGGVVLVSKYLDLSVDDALVSLGLRCGKLSEEEERELEELTETKPLEIPKVLVEHPYCERNLLWRFFFAIRRVCYLISLFVPVCVYVVFSYLSLQRTLCCQKYSINISI